MKSNFSERSVGNENNFLYIGTKRTFLAPLDDKSPMNWYVRTLPEIAVHRLNVS